MSESPANVNDDPAVDDKFVSALSSVARKFPGRTLSALTTVTLCLLTAGWTAARLLQPPSNIRERAAIDRARQEHGLAPTAEDDLVFLIQDFSLQLKKRQQQLASQLAIAEQRAVEAAETAAPEAFPFVGLYWLRGKFFVERCKQNGVRYLELEGFDAYKGQDNVGDVTISGMKNGSSVYVVCSDTNTIVVVSAASFHRDRLMPSLDALAVRFYSTTRN